MSAKTFTVTGTVMGRRHKSRGLTAAQATRIVLDLRAWGSTDAAMEPDVTGPDVLRERARAFFVVVVGIAAAALLAIYLVAAVLWATGAAVGPCAPYSVDEFTGDVIK